MPQTSWAVSGFGQSREIKYFVIDVESQYQGILTDIVHDSHSRSGVTYLHLMKQDFFHLRIITRKQLTAAVLLLVCNGMGFFSFFPRLIKVSVRSFNMLYKFTTRFIYHYGIFCRKLEMQKDQTSLLAVLGSRLHSSFAELKGLENVANAVNVGINTCFCICFSRLWRSIMMKIWNHII